MRKKFLYLLVVILSFWHMQAVSGCPESMQALCEQTYGAGAVCYYDGKNPPSCCSAQMQLDCEKTGAQCRNDGYSPQSCIPPTANADAMNKKDSKKKKR